jgi:hypothetical protein
MNSVNQLLFKVIESFVYKPRVFNEIQANCNITCLQACVLDSATRTAQFLYHPTEFLSETASLIYYFVLQFRIIGGLF